MISGHHRLEHRLITELQARPADGADEGQPL
jgi:hypothetical protein